MDESHNMHERITVLETHVGKSQDEGLRGDVKDVKKSVQHLWKHIYLSTGGAVVILWVAEHLFRKLPL